MKYEDLIDIELIEHEYYKVRLATKNHKKIVNFEQFYMSNIMQIYFILQKKQYKHNHYNIFLIREPKYRIIMSEIISDKIVNHVLSEKILLPLVEPKLIAANVATRKDKGMKKGLNLLKKYIHYYKQRYDNFYILKCDISKYFYNIDHNCLIEKIKQLNVDEEVLKIIRNIIETTNENYTNQQIKNLIEKEKKRLKEKNIPDLEEKFKELDKIPYYQNGKGIPIGNMSSQIFAIFYLNDLDHFIKEKLHIKGYIRYMDDLILFHQDKEYLKKCKNEIEQFLKKEKLELNNKTRIYSMKEGFQFIGYRFILKGKKLIVLLNSKTKKRIKKKLTHLKKIDSPHYNAVFASYYGYFLNANCNAFLYKHNWKKSSKNKKVNII